VLTNILQNGLDALKGVASPEIGISVEAAGERVTIVIADNGPGIAAADIPRAFSAFFTTKRDGLGLGLPISQGIVQDFGGQLTCQGQPGGGAEFTIDLRRAP
jgi:two-component system C4-dicarboxylate transport sensor histidine kinase DctB